MPLDGTRWVLISLNGKSLIEGPRAITLEFAGGLVSGSAGCNSYHSCCPGRYTATDDGSLTISGFAVTLVLCTGIEGLMEQEDAYIEALRNAATYRVIDDRLEIDNAAGETTLVFLKFLGETL